MKKKRESQSGASAPEHADPSDLPARHVQSLLQTREHCLLRVPSCCRSGCLHQMPGTLTPPPHPSWAPPPSLSPVATTSSSPGRQEPKELLLPGTGELGLAHVNRAVLSERKKASLALQCS